MQAPRVQRPPRYPEQLKRPLKMVDSKLQERVAEVLEVLVGKSSQQRKYRVADSFDAFLRARTSHERGWMTAADVDVFEWLCWLDSYGNGTKIGARCFVSRGGFGWQRTV